MSAELSSGAPRNIDGIASTKACVMPIAIMKMPSSRIVK